MRRELLNKGDLVTGWTEVFASGNYAQLGAVENFHTYSGQDHELTSHFRRAQLPPDRLERGLRV